MVSSTDFPVSAGAYDETHNTGNDIFVAKLNAADRCKWQSMPSAFKLN